MSPKHWLPALALATSVLSVPGCLFGPDIGAVVSAIESHLAPARLEPETELRIGPGAMLLARLATGFSSDPDARDAHAILRGVREVHLGVYAVRDPHLERGDRYRLPRTLRERLTEAGWGILAAVHEPGSAVWVLSDCRGDRVHGLYVVALEDEELVVVKLQGNLSHAIAAAVRSAMRRDRESFHDLGDLGA